MRALQVVQTDLKQLQSRDTVGAKQVDMRLYSVRSELLQQIRANTEELKNLQAKTNSLKYEIEASILGQLEEQKTEQSQRLQDYFQFKEQIYFYLDSKIQQLHTSYAKKFDVLFNFEKDAKQKINAVQEMKNKIEFAYDDFKAEWVSFQKAQEDKTRDYSHKVALLDGKLKDQAFFLKSLEATAQSLEKERGVSDRLSVIEERFT